MKRIKYFALAAILLCGTGLFSACSPAENDNPVSQEAIGNRYELISHINSDARIMADNFSVESFNATSQAYAQLLALIQFDKNFISNMKTILSALSDQKSLINIYPVVVGSELAKMGYLAYITVDNGGFGVRVIFDGKGGSRLQSADNLEFIFPAYVTGIGSTLFKLIIKNSDDCYQSVSTFNNLKRLACINRLPKSITMTLTGFIDDKELTLSESVINLELPQNEKSEYVNLDARSFKITGRQSTYLNANDESAIDYSLHMDGDNMILGYGYTRNGLRIVNCDAQMALMQKADFLSQMSKNAFDVADLKAFTIRLLDDLTFTGTITDGSTFAKDFGKVIQNRQLNSSSSVLNTMVESLNKSCRMQLSCEQITKPETVRFCLVQQDKGCWIEPGLKDLDSDAFVPISELLDAETMDYINKSFGQSFTPAGNAAGSALQFYSVFMQMMPLTGITTNK